MTLGDFLRRHVVGTDAAGASSQQRGEPPASEGPGRAAAGEAPAAAAEGPAAAAAPPAAAAGRGYLAQHELFAQLPALAADIATPDYCSLGEGGLRAVNAWLGPAGTETPFHTDPYHNLLAQVRRAAGRLGAEGSGAARRSAQPPPPRV